MDNINLRITYNSNLDNIVSCRKAFNLANLRIAYHGRNRNGSAISKEVFEQFASTMYNKPVVANYIREDDAIGGHDAQIVKKDGSPRLVNITQPVGVVPESA